MKVTPGRQFERSVLSATGELTDIVHIEFTVGDFGPFTVEVPKEDYIAGKHKAMIDEIARAVSTTAKGWEV